MAHSYFPFWYILIFLNWCIVIFRLQKGIPLNLKHFVLRAKDSGDWQQETITEQEFRQLLKEKIHTVKMEYVINDVRRFIKNPKSLEIWSPRYFDDLTSKLKFES